MLVDPASGRSYWICRANGRTEWLLPEAVLPLPAGCEARLDPGSGRHFFLNHHTQSTSWDDPRIGLIMHSGASPAAVAGAPRADANPAAEEYRPQALPSPSTAGAAAAAQEPSQRPASTRGAPTAAFGRDERQPVPAAADSPQPATDAGTPSSRPSVGGDSEWRPRRAHEALEPCVDILMRSQRPGGQRSVRTSSRTRRPRPAWCARPSSGCSPRRQASAATSLACRADCPRGHCLPLLRLSFAAPLPQLRARRLVRPRCSARGSPAPR